MAIVERRIIDQEDLRNYDPNNRPKPKNLEEQMREINLFEAYNTRPQNEYLRKWREQSVRK